MLVVPTVLGVSLVIFIVMRLLPGDPLVAIFGLEGARRMTPEQRGHLEQALGLHDPVVVQYAKWLRDVATGEFGKSLLRGDSVTEFHLLVYHGLLAPHAGWRAAVVPAPATGPSRAATSAGPRPPGRLSWPTLLRQVFALEVLVCPRPRPVDSPGPGPLPAPPKPPLKLLA